ncbi:MAG TPA: glycosyltransferase, partial [Deltaproteobacteria bacterium]|nr:glycosyltransferase [Deltaproteobacteria bacterium]
PTIRAIKKLLPKSLLDVVGKKGSLQVIEGWDLVHESFDYLDFKPSNKYDILLLTIWSNEFIKKHEKKINALDIPIIKKSFTNPDRHESQYHLDLARFIGYQGELPEPYCRTDRVTVPFKNSKPVALLSDTTFNSPEWQRKRWPYYRELAKALIEKGYQVGLIGGLDEANNFRQDDWPKGIINLMGKYSIPQTAYLISKADIFIGNDSGPSHIAGAVGTKAFIIFGATRETKNRPLGKSVDVITLNIPCRPCQYTQKWATCTNWQCVTNLSVGCILEHIDRNEAIGRISGLHHSSHSYCIDGLSVVIPTHNRSLLLISNIQKGRILGMTKKIIIDDNSDPQQKEILRALDNKQDITVVYSKRNEGVAKALKKSTPFVRTEYVTFGGDDDEIYVLNKKRFWREMSLLNNEYVLLTSRYVMNFNPEKETYSIGYCKADFRNIQAGELLKFMFCTGETAGTCIGNVYKTEQIMPTLPESVFRVSEDKVFMARLLGKNVDKKIHISESLVYIRRVSGDTLSRNYDSVKIFIDFLALLVCGYYCLENDLIDAEGIISHLRMRATLLEKIYGHALAIVDHIVEYLFDQITLDELFNDLNLDHLSSLSLPSEVTNLRNLLMNYLAASCGVSEDPLP